MTDAHPTTVALDAAGDAPKDLLLLRGQGAFDQMTVLSMDDLWHVRNAALILSEMADDMISELRYGHG